MTEVALIDAGGANLLEANVPKAVFETLQAFRRTAAFSQTADEWRHVVDYRKIWAAAPYPPTFVTADAVVVHYIEPLASNGAVRSIPATT